jgi:D-psicose/D-tagatose/L-ribulose 3-epimerase
MAKCGAWCLLWGPTFDVRYLYLIDHVAELGFDGLEIPLDDGILKNLPKKQMKAKMEENGMAVTFCAGLSEKENITKKSRAAQRRGVEYLKRCVDTVKEFGGDCLAGILYGVWGGFSGNPPTEDELERSASCIRTVAEYASTIGVDLAIEPCCRFECYLLATVEDGLRYIEMVGMPNLGLLLDTFQMNIEEKNLPLAIRRADKRLFHFHVCASDRGVPGTGHTDWGGVFEALKSIGYKRWLTVESFSPVPGGGAGRAAKVWRALASSPDEIAKGGLSLVRAHLM